MPTLPTLFIVFIVFIIILPWKHKIYVLNQKKNEAREPKEANKACV